MFQNNHSLSLSAYRLQHYDSTEWPTPMRINNERQSQHMPTRTINVMPFIACELKRRKRGRGAGTEFNTFDLHVSIRELCL